MSDIFMQDMPDKGDETTPGAEEEKTEGEVAAPTEPTEEGTDEA